MPIRRSKTWRIGNVVATAIKGLTGIGFSTSCLPIMALRQACGNAKKTMTRTALLCINALP